MAAVSCLGDRCAAAAAHPRLVGQTADRRARADAHERGPRRRQFQGEAGTRLAAALCKLARGFPDGAQRLVKPSEAALTGAKPLPLGEAGAVIVTGLQSN